MIHSDVFYKTCMSHPSIIIICDPKTGNIVEANNKASRIYEYSIEELRKLNIKDICNYSDDETKIIHDDSRKVFRSIHKNRSGKFMDMIVNSYEVKIDKDTTLLMNTIFPFNNSKKVIEEDIKFAENTNEPFIAIDHLCNVVLVNKLFEDLFGKINKNLIGKNIYRLLEYIRCYQSDDFYNSIKQGLMSTNNIKIMNKDNEALYFDMYSIPIFQSDSFFGTIITFKDTTIKTRKELMLHHIAYHDSLTNVHNRAYFIKYSDKVIQVAKENNMRVGIIFSDLDKLKLVNDTFGHKYGDLALQRVSKIMPTIIKDEEGFFRMGGDEFVAIITDENIISSIDKICYEIEKEVCKQYIVDNKDISVGITSGYSIFPKDSDNIENLLNIADRRMYARKRAKNLKRYE